MNMRIYRQSFPIRNGCVALAFLLLQTVVSPDAHQAAAAGSTSVNRLTKPHSDIGQMRNKSRPMTIVVDATDATRGVLHVRMTIPASGPILTLNYPKWIPGEHMPSGPINNLAGPRCTSGERTLAWHRDTVNMYSFHIDVPREVDSVDVELDYLAPLASDSYFSGSPITPQLAIINWNELLLYPEGVTADDVTVNTTLRLPSGWKFGTSLRTLSQARDEIRFAPTSLLTLIDSPLIAGANFRVVRLLPDYLPSHEIDIVSDSMAGLEISPDVIANFENLIKQCKLLFGSFHYRSYHFLLTVSDQVPHGGLEHSESDDSRVDENEFADRDRLTLDAGLLPHEFVHSWNGKYRRPSGELTADYEQPVSTDLIWVYEGLTSYLGDVLTARSGLWNAAQYRDAVAVLAARLDHVPGRTWRDLEDVSTAAQVLFAAPHPWSSWRRRVDDVYDEGELIWLWVDITMREKSHGQRSLDDFCRLFFGGQGGLPEVKPYNFSELVRELNKVVPYDWHTFLLNRLRSHAPRGPLQGIEDSGWHLNYSDTPSAMVEAEEKFSKSISATYSIGLELKEDGTILDTIEGMAAAQAGLGPGMRVVAVNGRSLSSGVLHAALRAGKNTQLPLEFLVANSGQYSIYRLDYHDGEKYPYLQRDVSAPDLLDQTILPLQTSR